MGIKKNVIYSGILTTSLYIFQFITYPYVARVLGVTNIGICNFAQSLVQYFVLFASLGTMSLGVREIAKCNSDQVKRNKVFSSIIVLNFIITAIVLILYLASIELVPQLQHYKKLLYVGALQLVASVFTIEWLFRGLEDFKFITLRNLAIRVLYVVAVFLFVRTRDDYTMYFVLTAGLYISNSIINIIYSRHLVKFRWQSIPECINNYMKPMSLLGIQNILLTMYTSFNVVYLGFVSGDTQVGYYTTATKIQNIILAMFSALTLVMMPRISSLIASKDYVSIRNLINQSLSVLFAFAIPIIIVVITLSSKIVQLIAGSEYGESVSLLRIAIPLILVIGMEQVLISQLLIPMGKDEASFKAYLVGATIGVIANITLVPCLESLGSIFVWALSEFAVMLIALYYVNKEMVLVKEMGALLFRYFIAFLPMAFVAYILRSNPISVIICTAVYSHVCLLYIVRNQVYLNLFKVFANKCIHK